VVEEEEEEEVRGSQKEEVESRMGSVLQRS
jgi:hypothetical protein